MYYCTVSVGQDVRSSLAQWSLFRVSHEASVKVLARVAVISRLSWGNGSKLTQVAVGSNVLTAVSWHGSWLPLEQHSPRPSERERERVPTTEDRVFFLT